MEAAERCHRMGGLVGQATRAGVLPVPHPASMASPGQAYSLVEHAWIGATPDRLPPCSTRAINSSKITTPRQSSLRARFLFEVRDDQVVGCVEVKKVQSYQAEVNHLTVHKDYCRGGSRKHFLMLLPRVPSKTEPASRSVRSGATMLRVWASF